MTDNKNLNDDFDFDELDFSNSKPLTDEEIKDLAEREVARFKEEQEHKRTVDDAYDKIVSGFKAAPRKDQEHYFAFKTERLERFKTLNIVVNDICNSHLGFDSYSYDRFTSGMFSEHATHQLITALCDIIERLADGDREGYTELTPNKKLAIKTLSIAIIDLSEGII